MTKIVPHLWFDKEAKEAANFYTSLFKNSKVKNITTLHNTPSGSVDVVSFALAGQEFQAISAGPDFKFTPAVSFMIACDSKEEVETFWKKLSPGGKALMELGSYPFSEKYGWIQDRYGLSWQVIFLGGEKPKQKITPVLLFVGKQAGKAEEAINFYISVFRDSKVVEIFRDGKFVNYGGFTLEGQSFAAMDSPLEHDFSFNEAISLMVNCDNQKEIDYYWGKLSADPKAEMCGWLKDKYGLSWQVVPTVMDKMLASKDQKKVERVTEAFLKMKKFDIAKLEEAYAGA